MRGAWIEIAYSFQQVLALLSLPVRGAWIEIPRRVRSEGKRRRSPCGERGLKSLRRAVVRPGGPSLPVRGAWIEIGRFSGGT